MDANQTDTTMITGPDGTMTNGERLRQAIAAVANLRADLDKARYQRDQLMTDEIRAAETAVSETKAKVSKAECDLEGVALDMWEGGELDKKVQPAFTVKEGQESTQFFFDEDAFINWAIAHNYANLFLSVDNGAAQVFFQNNESWLFSLGLDFVEKQTTPGKLSIGIKKDLSSFIIPF